MMKRTGNPANPQGSLSTPRGGSKPPIPPVPKLTQRQVKDLQGWASKHLKPTKKK